MTLTAMSRYGLRTQRRRCSCSLRRCAFGLHYCYPPVRFPRARGRWLSLAQNKAFGRDQPLDRNVKEIKGTTPLAPRAAAVTDVLVRPAGASQIWAGALAQPPCWFWLC